MQLLFENLTLPLAYKLHLNYNIVFVFCFCYNEDRFTPWTMKSDHGG